MEKDIQISVPETKYETAKLIKSNVQPPVYTKTKKAVDLKQKNAEKEDKKVNSSETIIPETNTEEVKEVETAIIEQKVETVKEPEVIISEINVEEVKDSEVVVSEIKSESKFDDSIGSYKKAISTLANTALKNASLPVQSFSWYQLNKLVEELELKNRFIKYLGEVLDKSDKMLCVFQEYRISSSGKLKKGQLYTIDNDVVFKFQDDGKPVERM